MGSDPAIAPVDESPGNEARQSMMELLAEVTAKERNR